MKGGALPVIHPLSYVLMECHPVCQAGKAARADPHQCLPPSLRIREKFLVGSIMWDFLLGWETPVRDLPRVTLTPHRLPPRKGFIKDCRLRTQRWAFQHSDPSLSPRFMESEADSPHSPGRIPALPLLLEVQTEELVATTSSNKPLLASRWFRVIPSTISV